MKFWIKTLGCKVNQVESAYMVEKLKEAGYALAEREEEAQIFILNSCAVTEGAYRETKKVLRQWSRLSPSIIILTGCSAQGYAEEFEKMALNLDVPHFLILGQDQKYELTKFLRNLTQKLLVDTAFFLETCYPLKISQFHGHSRAFVKIQDGCSSFCSYCIVPYTRGPSKSLPEGHIIEQIKIFLESGYEEIVLTGIHLGMWGEDLKPKRKLGDLLFSIEKLMEEYKRPLNLRLSSLEINELDEDFISFAKESKFLCPHFHVPLQSGSNLILQKMNRRYSAEEYLEKVKVLAELFPEATLGADVIVGFPGEGEKEFGETYTLIERSPLNWLHVFPFSARPKTPAGRMEPKVRPEIIKKRLLLLKELHSQKRKEFLNRELGKIKKVVIEETEPPITGLTDNYIQTTTFTREIANFERGEIVYLKLSRLRGNLVEAEPLKDEQIVKA